MANVSSGDRDVARARKLADVLDRVAFLDPIVGFFAPAAGDVVTSLVGLYVVAVGLQKRVHPVVIARMLINLAVDTGIGLIPVVGDVFDFFHRAHAKNVRLLEQRHVERRPTAGDWAFVVGAAVLLLAALALPFVLLAWAIAAIV